MKIASCQTSSYGDSVSPLSKPAVDSLKKKTPEPPPVTRDLISSIRKVYFSQSRRPSLSIAYNDKLSSIEYHAQLFNQTRSDSKASSARLSQQSQGGFI